MRTIKPNVTQIFGFLWIMLAVAAAYLFESDRCHYQSSDEATRISTAIKQSYDQHGSFSVRDVHSGNALFFCLAGKRADFDVTRGLFLKHSISSTRLPEDCGFWFGSARLVIFSTDKTIDVPVPVLGLGYDIIQDSDTLCSSDLNLKLDLNTAQRR
jgi:hypothetical protein